MEEKTALTLERIKEAALTEFLEKGYQGASLRQIVKNAGVTTGAFYFPARLRFLLPLWSHTQQKSWGVL